MQLWNSERIGPNLRLLVDVGVHLWADEGEEAHAVTLSKVILPSVSQAQTLVLQYLSGDKGGSSEP